MVLKYLNLMLIFVLLLLSSCSPLSKKIKKTDRYSGNNDPFFLPISEESVRDDVREQYVLKDKIDEDVVLLNRMSRKQKKQFVSDRVREKEAKLIDIPLLLSTEPISDFFLNEEENVNVLGFGYNVSMLKNEVVSFYKKGMERNGWRKTFETFGAEVLISFVKPDRFCSISIRPANKQFLFDKSGVVVVLYVGLIV